MLTDEYISMKELAKLFGSTQKKIGLGFEKKKLWVVGGGATPKAIQESCVALREYPGYEDHPLTIWHKKKAIAALESIDFKLLPMYAAYSSGVQMTDEDESEHDEHEGDREDDHEDEDTDSNSHDRMSRDDGYGYDGYGDDDDFRRFDND